MPILTREEVIAELDARLKGTSVRKLAAKIGVSRNSVYQVLKGKRAPGPLLLQYLNLEKETETSVAYRVVTEERDAA